MRKKHIQFKLTCALNILDWLDFQFIMWNQSIRFFLIYVMRSNQY
jgi:hypothetical protein